MERACENCTGRKDVAYTLKVCEENTLAEDRMQNMTPGIIPPDQEPQHPTGVPVCRHGLRPKRFGQHRQWVWQRPKRVWQRPQWVWQRPQWVWQRPKRVWQRNASRAWRNMVDAPALGAGDESRGGSSPSARTNQKRVLFYAPAQILQTRNERKE